MLLAKDDDKMKKWWIDLGKNNGGTDEWYTPVEAVTPLLPYLKPKSRILCPFDTEDSNYVKVFKENGFKVSHSHIIEGEDKDFFRLEKPNVDYIISNPPYSLRDKVIARLYEWDIPFAIILNMNGIFDSFNRLKFAMEKGAEVLYLYPRVHFIKPDGSQLHAPFQSGYLCHNILPKELCFSILDERMNPSEITPMLSSDIEIKNIDINGQLSLFDL